MCAQLYMYVCAGVPGFIVLGPDYFFGKPMQDLPAGHDKATWADESLATARQTFPKWLDAVKEVYGAHQPQIPVSRF